MLSRRLQVLVDDEQFRRLEAAAAERRVSVAVVVREAIDAAVPALAAERSAAAARILAAEPMAVPDVADLLVELDDLRSGGA